MNTMRAVQVKNAAGPFQQVERDVREPLFGEVRVKVKACGICHSDAYTKEGYWPGIQYPRIPGHEIAGVVDAVGANVDGWKVGDRVGIGWHGGHCGHCESCRHGDYVMCMFVRDIPGITIDGGYADYVYVPPGTLARVPDLLSFEEAAPLMCAGVTTYNSLRNSGAKPGDCVAILGVGGLGHLAVQFAARMGFNTIAIARGKEKEEGARKLGAHDYIDSQAQNPAEELTRRGGAKVILATVTNGEAMTAALGGLSINGKFVVLGAPADSLQIPAALLISGRRSIMGWPSGSSIDSQDTMAFSALTGVRSVNEVYPLQDAPQAYKRMMSGKARFRIVLSLD